VHEWARNRGRQNPLLEEGGVAEIQVHFQSSTTDQVTFFNFNFFKNIYIFSITHIEDES
jgi:hypothetical protein